MTPTDTTFAHILEQLIADGPQEVQRIVTTLLNLAMVARKLASERTEREQFLGAGHYERGTERRGYANAPSRRRSTHQPVH